MRCNHEMGPAVVDFSWPSGGGNNPGDECMEPYFGGFGDFKIKTGG